MTDLRWTYETGTVTKHRYLTAETETHLFMIDTVPSAIGPYAVNYRLMVSTIGRFDRSSRSEHRFATEEQARRFAQSIADRQPAAVRTPEEPDPCPECGAQDGQHEDDCIDARIESYEVAQEDDR